MRRLEIPVIDGYRNLRRVHGTLGFRALKQRSATRAASLRDGRARTPPARAPDPFTEVSAWPFPETYSLFVELKETQGPAYENRSTVASTELLMEYTVDPYLRAPDRRARR